MRSIIAPDVDMLLVSRNSRNERKLMLNFAPKIGLSIVNYGGLEQIDNFYIDCQNMRDYYRDPYSKLPRPTAFKKHYGKCGSRTVDRNTELLTLPVKWVTEKQPVIYPIEYGRALQLNEGIVLGGQYDPYSCIKYKR